MNNLSIQSHHSSNFQENRSQQVPALIFSGYFVPQSLLKFCIVSMHEIDTGRQAGQLHIEVNIEQSRRSSTYQK